MSERDPVVALLKELERPAAPRPEFAEALRRRLLAELAEPNGAAGRLGPRPRLTLPPRRRRSALLAAITLAVAAATIAAVLLSRPSQASALDVIRQARQAFAAAPPFQATLRIDLNPDGSNRDRFVPKGATTTLSVSYGGPRRFRTEIVAETPRVQTEARGPGSYDVFDGRRIGSFHPERKFFNSSPAPKGFGPLEYLSWHGAYPDWERICRSPGSRVLPDARIAGRDARHIRCGGFKGGFWELWIDRETGLMLKTVGQIGGDDVFVGVGPTTSAKGRFEVEQIRYHPSFPAGTFKVVAPPGALDYQGRMRAAAASVPPFRAVVDRRFNGRRDAWKIWWRTAKTWREQVLSGRFPLPGGPRSFAVSADGSVRSYNAREKSHSSALSSSNANPILELLPEADPRYSTRDCPIVGHDRIAGRVAVRRHCSGYDIWIDGATGLLLRQVSPGYELRVRSLEYRPTFPPETFRFVAPSGARSAHRLANDPYYKTKLAPGKIALPNWSAPRLSRGTFSLDSLRGKPALLLLFSDTCPPGDPTCDVFPQLEHVYKHGTGRVAIAWIDIQGSASEARKITRHQHLTFPVVVDDWHRNVVTKAWNIQGYPYWLLLDSNGRVIEARLKPQTIAQLQQLLAEAR